MALTLAKGRSFNSCRLQVTFQFVPDKRRGSFTPLDIDLSSKTRAFTVFSIPGATWIGFIPAETT
ncbi:hypothetical protein F2Q69_00031432 [Brassica cretica]|uniref:Uncharacterized protein n=1 Tax=Brassica cretica TaxID=69181 RepID=A0A8S9S2X7_BRACR|nr:hypothetical protein F2Q69_00031432 [Brassica cretica]